MILIDTLRTDWSSRLPFHLKYNRYIGLARTCFQLLAILYYILKAIILLELLFFYFFFKGLWTGIKWVFKLDDREWFVRLKSIFDENDSGDIDGDFDDADLLDCDQWHNDT